MIESIKKKFIDEKYIIYFCFTFLYVIICNGPMIFNKITWHDDSSLLWGNKIDINTCIGNGRWFLWALISTFGKLNGTESTSTSLGILAGIILASAVCCVLYIYNIKSKIMRIGLCVIFASMPQTLSHFGYIVTIGHDDFGALLAIMALLPLAIMNYKSSNKPIFNYMLSCVLLCMSIGEYQCNLTLYLVAVLLFLIYEILVNEYDFKHFFIKGITYIAIAIVSLALYFVIMRLSLVISGISLSSYAGISSFGVVSAGEYVKRILRTYKYFLREPVSHFMFFPFENGILFQRIYLVCYFLTLVIVELYALFKKKISFFFEVLISVGLVPLAFGFNIVMYGADSQHSLHTFHYGLLYVVPFLLVRYIAAIKCDKTVLEFLKNKVVIIVAVCALILGIRYTWYDSVVYTNTLINHEQTISYLNRMISRVESIEGYSKDKTVVFVNSRENDVIGTNHSFITTNPYESNGMINSYMWDWLLYYYCGFQNPSRMYDNMGYDDIIYAMDAYPNENSIILYDDKIFIRMN